MKFSYSFKIQTSDIDEHFHVNNVAYLRWIQEVAVAHWQSVTTKALQENYTWFVLRHEIDYKSRAFESEEITATTWVGKATKIKCERFTEINRGRDVLVRAKSIWCLLDTAKNKPARITNELRELFQMK